MAAGLPGTGIGGLFFILSAFLMIPVELVRTINGRSSLERWKIVGRNAGIAAAMVATVTTVVWLLHGLLFSSPPKASATSGGVAHQLLPFAPVLITLAVLVLVLVVAYLAKFVFHSAPTTVPTTQEPRQPKTRLTAEPILASRSSRSNEITNVM